MTGAVTKSGTATAAVQDEARGPQSGAAMHRATRPAANPPRILHVMDKLSVGGSRIAGPARLMSYYVPELSSGHCDVLLCSLRQDDSAKDFLTRAGVDVVCLDRGKYDLRTLRDLQRLAARWGPSLLHLHGYASWTFGRIVGRQRGIPVVLQEHFVDDRVPLVQRAADRVLRRRQQYAIAVSGPVKDFMIERRYLIDTPVEIVWNAVPVDAIRRAAARSDPARLRKSLGIPAEAPVVGIVGRLAEEKGHEYFLDIGARVAAARPDVHFVIVGEGPRREPIEAHAARLGLAGRTHLAGHQDDVVPWLRLFSVSLMTSRREGFPAVPLESLAAGTPVVMTDLDVFRGVYTDERDVLKIPPGDPETAAGAVLRLLGDASLVARLAENAGQLLEACSVKSIVPRYAKIYRELLCLPEQAA
ncbi:MAG TPA: glycosyltransferase family 4 protein [Woeseiaceae bacterium]|nr:glycosyltransferase family 4 protein [Woeseiaceae bacterium]